MGNHPSRNERYTRMVRIRVWDLPLRLFHWSLVLLVTISIVTGLFGSDLGLSAAQWHKLSGYAVLALLLFRLSWGFAGSTYSRFGSFMRGPRIVMQYVGELAGRHASAVRPGHNPLGGWATLVMLLSLLVQAVTGLFLSDEDLGLEGPLAKYVSGATGDSLNELHEGNATLLLILIGLHLCAIAAYRFLKGENLVKPMITGFKQLPSAPEEADARGGHLLLAVVLFATSVGIVWYIANRL